MVVKSAIRMIGSAMPDMVCHFHADEWSAGVRQQDGTYAHSCDRTVGHPGGGTWHWLEVPQPKDTDGLTGLAEELNLESELPAALAALGAGWWKYGLVERSCASRCPDGWARMVEQWGHTAIAAKRYTASSYLAGTLGRLSRLAAVASTPASVPDAGRKTPTSAGGAPCRPRTGVSARPGPTSSGTSRRRTGPPMRPAAPTSLEPPERAGWIPAVSVPHVQRGPDGHVRRLLASSAQAQR